MTTYVTILNTQVDPDSPITTQLMTALRDNPIALAERDPSAPQIVPQNVQVFTSSGTFTVPPGVNFVDVWVTGEGQAGGNGSGSSTSPSSGSGGDSSATAIKRVDVSGAGGSVAVTVGATSSFGSFCSASTSGATGGDLNLDGGTGQEGTSLNFTAGAPTGSFGGGKGAESYWGGGYGAGGNGGRGQFSGSGSISGDAGKDGVVVVRY